MRSLFRLLIQRILPWLRGEYPLLMRAEWLDEEEE